MHLYRYVSAALVLTAAAISAAGVRGASATAPSNNSGTGTAGAETSSNVKLPKCPEEEAAAAAATSGTNLTQEQREATATGTASSSADASSAGDDASSDGTCSLYLSQTNVGQRHQSKYVKYAQTSVSQAGHGLFAGRAMQPGQLLDANPELALSYPDANINEWSSWNDIFYKGIFADSLFNDEGGVENEYFHHWFLPGIASLARCEMDVAKVNIVHAPPAPRPRGRDGDDPAAPTAGSNSHRIGYTYVATRSIDIGEELLVSCDYDLDNLEQSRTLQESAGDGSYQSNTNSTSTRPKKAKTPQELQEKSICLDNFVIKPSTIPNIGLGAYAKRSVPIGEPIVTSPVIHFDRSQVDVVEQHIAPSNCRLGSEDTEVVVDGEYSNQLTDCPTVTFTRDHGVWYNNTASPPGRSDTQLLINYCYGHPDSQILLLPLAPGVNYINHQRDRFKVNAYLRWSGGNGLADPTYLHSLRPTEALDHAYLDMSLQGNGLLVDIVALRDIQEGEEIFLSYGKEWSDAWEKHVTEWNPSAEGESEQNFPSAANFRKEMAAAGKDAARTKKEQEANPYPDKLRSACYYAATEEDEATDETHTAYKWTESNRGCLRPCDILDRSTDRKGVTTYTVLARKRGKIENDFKCSGVPEAGIKLINVPSNAITVIDDYYTSDQYLPTAFRHEIGVPTNFFPSTWMRDDPMPYGDFLGTPLPPGEVQVIRWADTGKVVTPNAYRAGLPSSVRETLLEYCEKLGIIDIFRHATVEGNGLEPGTDAYMYLDGKGGDKGENSPSKASHQQWFLQRPAATWRSNLHWFSPSDAASQDSYIEALGAGGFDQVLDGIGRALGLDGLVAYHITFIAASHSIKGYQHYDMRETGAKVYNVIIPLLLAEETGPELDLGSYECDIPFGGVRNGAEEQYDGDDPYNYCVGRYRYEYDVASLMGDDAMHATSAVDYRRKSEMRMAATVYIADVNKDNVDSTISHYTQAYPPADRDLILSWAGKHWLPTGGRQLPRPKPGEHVLSPL